MNEQAFDSRILESISRIIADRTGLRPTTDVMARLPQIVGVRMAALGVSSPSIYLARLTGASSGHELRRLASLLAVRETHFFRDRGQFSLLGNIILPQLIKNREPRQRLRILSAGCATGEEAYSLAMLVDEIIPNRAEWDIRMLGVDMDEDAISQAQTGLYTDWSFRGTDSGLKGRCFHKRSGGWELDERIRSMVAFRVMNLVEDGFPSADSGIQDIDLAVCRNVFIYFNQASVDRVFKKLASSLSIGGYLVTGHAETLGLSAPGLAVRMFPESVVYQRVAVHEKEMEQKPPQLTPEEKGGAARMSPAPQPSAPKQDEEKPHPSTIRVAEPKEEILALIRDGLFDKAARLAEGSDATGDEGFARVFLKAWALADSGEYAKAMDGFNEAVRINPVEPVTYYLIAQIHQLEGAFDKSKEALRKALYLDHAFIPAHLELAYLYERDNDMERARKNRTAALDVLGSMPPERRIGWYDMTVAEVIKSVKNFLE